MQRNRIVKLAFVVALLGGTLHVAAPPPAMALTCPQECQQEYYSCLRSCGLNCFGDEACFEACNADCSDARTACVNDC